MVVGAGVSGGQLRGGVDVVLQASARHRDVEVLTVEAGAGQDDADVGGRALRTVDGGGPPVLGVPGQVGAREGEGAATAQVRHDQPTGVAGGQDAEPVAVAQGLAPDAGAAVVLLREEHVPGPPGPLLRSGHGSTPTGSRRWPGRVR